MEAWRAAGRQVLILIGVTGRRLVELTKVTDAARQQGSYRWKAAFAAIPGHAEEMIDRMEHSCWVVWMMALVTAL